MYETNAKFLDSLALQL